MCVCVCVFRVYIYIYIQKHVSFLYCGICKVASGGGLGMLPRGGGDFVPALQ